ncbi:peptide-methionine (S)-S-oxide reductase MsrA [Candidatus Micrarchaeota archaeon]|nr:peptide-methionine (S)-S-oxide reductase MsrA [Candidatus Micrarchaeota archaeon]
MEPETAVFAAGCFWGVEDIFRKVKGVRETAVGYAGGHTENPAYQDACTGRTGHAEAVQVKYDPEEVSYRELLEVFWSIHDPAQVNRQGPDVGSQYRSAIFYQDERQKELAEQSKKEEQERHSRPIATEIAPAGKFWKAEDYHQKYHEKHGIACHVPNLDAIRHLMK